MPPDDAPPRASRALAAILASLAVALLGSMLAAALHDVSSLWDVWYYHLPFAARIWGIVPARAFAFHAANEARFGGFPLLAEALQGLFWRLFGFPQAANLVAFSAVPLYAWFLRRRFRVPWHLSVLALMAIPLVHLHATSAYDDLPGNTCAAILLLTVHALHADPGPVSDRSLLAIGLAAAGAANMRFQLHLVVLLALAAAAARVIPDLRRRLRGPERPQALRRVAWIAVALPIVFASPLKNAIVHHNPYYPMKLALGPVSLPGPEGVYSNAPPYLANAPRPQRFVYSLLEIGIRPMSDRRRWTLDQWMPSDSTGNRMGGFFGVYVVYQVILFVYQVARDKSRPARAAGAFFGALTVASSLQPQSHELRYYLYWMIVLVSLNLVLASRRGVPPPPLARPEALGIASVAALAVVLWVTRAGYAYPSGSTFTEFVRDKVDARVLGQIREGDRVCLEKEPWNILYAATFHAPGKWAVKEAERREECGDHRWIE